MLHQAIAHKSLIDEDEDGISVQLLELRFGYEAMQPHFARSLRLVIFASPPWWRLGNSSSLQVSFCCNGNELIERVAPKDLVKPLGMLRHWRRSQHVERRRVQLEVLIRMRQCVVGHERGNVRELSRFRSQELLSCRNVEEEIANADRGADRYAGLFHFEQLAARDLNARTGSVVCLPRLQTESRNGSDGGQRLPAKAKRIDVQQ